MASSCANLSLPPPLISGLQTVDSLKKADSFSHWVAKELLEADDLNMHSSGGISLSVMGSEYDDSNMTCQLQAGVELSSSISQDQLFSIIGFSPNWAYSNLETKSDEELSKYRWSIMFGEVEVPAEVLADGLLSFCAPIHEPGRVPFYLICSDMLGCSEIREFEYRLGPDHITSAVDGDYVIVMHLYERFEMIFGLWPVGSPISSSGSDVEKQNVMNKILSLMEQENDDEVSMSSINDASQLKLIGQLLLKKQLKQKFYSWLLHRVNEDGKGLTVLDERGQSVLCCTWQLLLVLIGPSNQFIVSRVIIDFRDVNGWKSLHWAVFYGREETVAILVAHGAAPESSYLKRDLRTC